MSSGRGAAGLASWRRNGDPPVAMSTTPARPASSRPCPTPASPAPPPPRLGVGLAAVAAGGRARLVALRLAGRACRRWSLSHAPFWWATLVPDSALFSPVLRRLPTRVRRSPGSRSTTARPTTRRRSSTCWMRTTRRPRSSSSATAPAHGPSSCARSSRRGHGIGNHSATHPQAWFWALPPRRDARRDRTHAGHAARTHRHHAALVPRGGGHGQSLRRRGAEEHGLTRVAWSARGYDALASRSRTRRGAHRTPARRPARSSCCTKARSMGATWRACGGGARNALQALGYRDRCCPDGSASPRCASC